MQRGLQSFCSTPESADERRPGTQVSLSRTSSKRKFTGSCIQPVADALSTKRVFSQRRRERRARWWLEDSRRRTFRYPNSAVNRTT
uniref:Uncharacterized protein n=1 Tax=Plectus sambesii TaxID=2011161 RepID=A0A914V2X7_9BILA